MDRNLSNFAPALDLLNDLDSPMLVDEALCLSIHQPLGSASNWLDIRSKWRATISTANTICPLQLLYNIYLNYTITCG